ncbi:MAG: cytochrome c oxidase subunit 3 [Planctomycetota bacterium]
MSEAPPTLFSKPSATPGNTHRVPRGTNELGMYLFLAALAMLFVASMLGYVLVRWSKTRVVMDPDNPDLVAFPATAPPLGTIHMPAMLWLSTLIILASSVTIHLAVKNIERERQAKFRSMLIATLVLSLLFLLVQLPSLGTLIYEHFRNETGNTMLGLVFFLVLVHALHVVGGIIPLAVVTYKAGQGRYDHEHYVPVKNVTMYWHFLDGVWLFMFAVLLVTG